MNRHIIFFTILIQTVTAGAEVNYIQRQEVQSYLEEIVKSYGFDKKELHKLIGGVKKQKSAIKALDRPAEAKPWHEYRNIFLTKARIEKGVLYWRKNKHFVKKASEHYKVAPEIIVSLLGIETFYGRITGRFLTLDTLVTLGFDYPRRSKFFRKELTQFLLLCREENLDCSNVTGSHGSAMGLGQFIPSSYRAYAVDFDGDGKRDLWKSDADVLGSVANYISKHGWILNAPVAEITDLQAEPLSPLLNKKLKPFLGLKDLQPFNITGEHFSPQEEPFILLGLQESAKNTAVWVGYYNFYVITRYNHSRRYAMAVYQLSRELKRNINR